MASNIDLHVHSTASDGTFHPAELVSLALETGLSAFALTDHDSTDGIGEALAAAEGTGLEVVPGVELSTEYNGTEIHVVGLYIDRSCKPFCEHLKTFRDSRDNRNLKMIVRLQEEGFSITEEELHEKFGDCVLTRAHFARHLVDSGQVGSIPEVFDRYLGSGCKCFVDRPKITPVEAVKLIRRAGGTAILAHPCMYKIPREEIRAMAAEMAEAGLEGIESIYSRSRGDDEAYFTAMAESFGILISGGSDFHGTNKPDIKLGTGTGNLNIPYSILEKIKASRQQKCSS